MQTPSKICIAVMMYRLCKDIYLIFHVRVGSIGCMNGHMYSPILGKNIYADT